MSTQNVPSNRWRLSTASENIGPRCERMLTTSTSPGIKKMGGVSCSFAPPCRSKYCELPDSDAYDLTRAGGRCTKVRDIEVAVRTEGHCRRNRQAGCDNLNVAVREYPPPLAISRRRISRSSR